jgi:flagellar protein FliS
MAVSAANHSAYKRVDVETASQGKLIVMLYNGAIQRAEEARRQIERGRVDSVHNNLVRAQEIVAELRSALNMSAGEVAQSLDKSYEYFQHLLIKANLRKDIGPIQECVKLMSELRDAWQELFDRMRNETPDRAPQMDPHGASVINVQG